MELKIQDYNIQLSEILTNFWSKVSGFLMTNLNEM